MMRLVAFLLCAFLTIAPAMALAFELRIVTNTLEEDLRGTSLLVPLTDADSASGSQDVVAAAQADYARLVGLMYDRGYFSPQVSILIDGREAATLSPVQPMTRIGSVEVRVDTGPAFQFGRARIAPVPKDTTLPEAFVSGGDASTRALQDAVKTGVSSWRAKGYAKAALASQTITARHDGPRLDADIRLDPGPRLRFGDLKVSGNKRMRANRITAIAGLPKGKIFNPDDIDRAGARLRRSGVFSSISLSEAERVGVNSTLDIEAQIAEAKLRRFGFGAELSSHDGLGLSAFWLHRNLLGGAEQLRIGGEITGLGGTTGGNDYELTLAFSHPATFGTDTDFYTDAAISRFQEPNFSSDRASIEAGVRRYASAQTEYAIGVGYTAANTIDTFGARSYRILTLPLSAEFDYRDNALDTTKGYYAKAELTPFTNLRGTANGMRGYLDTRAYRSLGQDNRITLALRGQLGVVSGPSLTNAPADFLFYSGGGGTVRGQDYQSLGVDLGGGNVIGGASFAGLSGEVRVKAGEKLSFVGFYDVGLIGSDVMPNASNSKWHSGAGLGARYDTGIGPIRFDVAAPLAEPLRAKNIKLYIGIGQSF